MDTIFASNFDAFPLFMLCAFRRISLKSCIENYHQSGSKVSDKLQSQHFLRSVQLVSWHPWLLLKLGSWALEKEQEVAPPLPSELSESSGGVAAHPMQRSSYFVSRESVPLHMFSVAQSMGIATPKLIGKEELTSETATGSVMVFPCLQML